MCNRNRLLKVTLFMVALLVWPGLQGEALALSCASPELTESIIHESAAIFEGRATGKHSPSPEQKAALEKAGLSGKGLSSNGLRLYDFTITKRWKGKITEGQTVAVLLDTSWGDDYPHGVSFLIVSPKQVGGMFLNPLCGNSVDLSWARQKGDISELERVIGEEPPADPD